MIECRGAAEADRAVFHKGTCGVRFGQGVDLTLKAASNAPEDSFDGASYTHFPRTYMQTLPIDREDKTFTGARKFVPAKVEVFVLTL